MASTRASDGTPNVWASESGMAGTFDPVTFIWHMFRPLAQVEIVSDYDGRRVSVKNSGLDWYWLRVGDDSQPWERRRYAARWGASVLYSALGEPIADVAEAVPGDPVSDFFIAGPLAYPETPPAAGSYTRGSDGSSNVWIADSGMAGTVLPSGRWLMFKPAVGVTYESRYRGYTISVKNNGDGTYTLDRVGSSSPLSRQWYADRWMRSVYFDSQGNPIANSDQAIPGEPADAYYAPGPDASMPRPSPPANPPATPPATTTTTTTRGGNVVQLPPRGNAPPANNTPPAGTVVNADFPTVPAGTDPGPSPAVSTAAKLAIAAIAAYLMS